MITFWHHLAQLVAQNMGGFTLSVLDEVRTLEKQVLDRLHELEPAVAEYHELRRVAERLDLKYEPNGSKAQPARTLFRSSMPP